MHVVNLSVGTANEKHRPRFEEVLRRACSQEVFVVSAANMLPGMLDGAIGVDADPECDRETCRFHNGRFLASPYPRSIPGVPKELNFSRHQLRHLQLHRIARKALGVALTDRGVSRISHTLVFSLTQLILKSSQSTYPVSNLS